MHFSLAIVGFQNRRTKTASAARGRGTAQGWNASRVPGGLRPLKRRVRTRPGHNRNHGTGTSAEAKPVGPALSLPSLFSMNGNELRRHTTRRRPRLRRNTRPESANWWRRCTTSATRKSDLWNRRSTRSTSHRAPLQRPTSTTVKQTRRR